MVTPEVLAYARAKQGAGVAVEDIKKALLTVGWDVASIDEIIHTIEQEKPAQDQKSQSTPVQPAQTTAKPAQSLQASISSTPASATANGTAATGGRITVTPTLRALTAIDSQLRAGVDKKTVQDLLLGVGWAAPAIEEAFLAVDWGESLLRPNPDMPSSPDVRAPKLHVVDETLAQSSTMPTRRALTSIEALLQGGASKGNIRTLLLGVGWDVRAIDEAFLAVEWRDDSGGAGANKPSTPVQQTTPVQRPELVTPAVSRKVEIERPIPIIEKPQNPALATVFPTATTTPIHNPPVATMPIAPTVPEAEVTKSKKGILGWFSS